MKLDLNETRIKSELETAYGFLDHTFNSSKPSKLVVLADLNAEPPETDDHEPFAGPPPELARLANDESSQEKTPLTRKESDNVELEGKKIYKSGKCRTRNVKAESFLDYGGDGDAGDQPGQGAASTRDEKVSSLKTGLVHVARKMPKNAHAHFILGLMYQRLDQTQKAILAYEKAAEILLCGEPEIARSDLLSLVQMHHAQCLLLESLGDKVSNRELEPEELEEVLLKLKESVESDIRHTAIWNTLGLILLKAGRLQSAISVFSSLLVLDTNNYDCMGNLGIAYLQNGQLELSAKCFQGLILKDQNHPAALTNYATLLLCQHGSVIAGVGASAGGASKVQVAAVNVAKQCLLAVLKSDPKAAHIWANLANAYHVTGDQRSSIKCLEKAAKLESNCMSTRYAVAVNRIKDAERSQDPSEHLPWAGNEMASIIREGDSITVEPSLAWEGLSMVQKTQYEIAMAFDKEQNELTEMEEHAIFTSKQAIAEDPDCVVPWNQLGLHTLHSRQFRTAQKYLMAAVNRSNDCSYAWSNLGISLQLSEEPSQAESVYKRALSLATFEKAHAIFSNLGNLYRQQKHYEHAKAMFTKSLELQPGYAPAFNNVGLVFVAEGRWEEAKICFEKALQADPLLDAAKSNMIKTMRFRRLCAGFSSCFVDTR